MPVTISNPDSLRTYLSLGVCLDWKGSHRTQAIGECPFCGKENKFYVSLETGLADCKSCGWSDNPIEFVRELWKVSLDATSEAAYATLSKERKLLSGESLASWSAARSIITGEWLVPGYSYDGRLMQLYRWRQDFASKEGKMRLMPCPGLEGHGLYGMATFDSSVNQVYLCEGFWDGVCLYETLREAGMLESCTVLAVPSCNVFFEPWSQLFAGKTVYLMTHNDYHLNKKTGQWNYPALDGARRVTEILFSHQNTPLGVLYLRWGDDPTPSEGCYSSQLPSGYDVRDHLGKSSDLATRIELLSGLASKMSVVPSSWIEAAKVRQEVGNILPCESWSVLENQGRKAMYWTKGLSHGLACSLATVVSTPCVGDQLWIKLIGPPSCGKSIFCEALATNKKHIYSKDSIRGFASGMTDKTGKEDNSLIKLIKGKTLVTKDGDTLLQAPNLSQILSEARALYDGAFRVHYRNKIDREDVGHRFTWVLCGTESLRQLDCSELGERMLDVVMCREMSEELEDEIGMRAAYEASRELSIESNGKMESQSVPDMTLFKQLTGGYVDYLRRNAQRLLDKVQVSDNALRYCQRLGTFVSFMRARPSKKQEEAHQRELSFRLIKQLVRLAKCLAVVLNKTEVDKEVLGRVRQVALDTSRGRTLNIAAWLYQASQSAEPGGGMFLSVLATYCNQTEEKKRTMMRFLAHIGVVECYRQETAKGLTSSRFRWRLTQRLLKLYREVVVNA